MTCEQIRQLWGDDELNPEVRRHLAECSGCRQAIEEHAQLLQVMEEWAPRSDVPADFETRLYQRIREAEAQPAWRRWWSFPAAFWTAWTRPPRLALAGALFSLLLLVSASVLYRAARPQPKPPLPVTQVAKSDPVVRDLQVLDQDSDMLENFDFLNGSSRTDTQTQPTENP